MVDYDKESEYSLGNIKQFIMEKKGLSPFLLAILLGSAGLILLLYKNAKIREFLMNCLKRLTIIPEFLKSLLGIFGPGISDFLEKYNDSYRLLGFIIILFSFWLVFRLLMKFIIKLMKKTKEENKVNNN